MSMVAQRPVAGGLSWTALTRHRSARAVVGSIAVALFLIGWQIVGANEIVRSDLISYPSEVARTLYQMSASG
jgi:ABC-type nitrate/sulfonate/bicarbonate transport system permease component